MRDLKKNKDVLLGNGMWRKYDNLKGTFFTPNVMQKEFMKFSQSKLEFSYMYVCGVNGQMNWRRSTVKRTTIEGRIKPNEKNIYKFLNNY